MKEKPLGNKVNKCLEVDKVANNANKKMADIKLNMVADKDEDKEDKAADKVSDIVRHVESFLQHVSFIHMPKQKNLTK